MKIWTLLVTYLKLSIVFSKKADIGKIFAEYWQKNGLARPSPLKFAARFVKPGIYNPVKNYFNLNNFF